jgi:two-component system, LytTR family, response regulator
VTRDKLWRHIVSKWHEHQNILRLIRQTAEHDCTGYRVPVDRINWIEAVKNYGRAYAGNDAYLIRGTLEGLNRKLDPKKFLRVNRSRIINVEFIKELQRWFHGEHRINLKNGTEMMWKRRYLDKPRT